MARDARPNGLVGPCDANDLKQAVANAVNSPLRRLIILTGPSCMGKTPLLRSLRQLHPKLTESLQTLTLLNSRIPRPGEVDGVEHHFRSRASVEALKSDPRFLIINVRGDLQALDLEKLQAMLAESDVLYEGNPYVAKALCDHSSLADVNRIGVFLSPLSLVDLQFLKSQANVNLSEFVRELMLGKQRRRAQRQLGRLTTADEEDIQRRAAHAFAELQDAHLFDVVLPNHDGEDSDHWLIPGGPVGDALLAVHAVADILHGRNPPNGEIWPAGLLSNEHDAS
jgi:guanylate kinase